MLSTSDDRIKEICEGISEVDYIVGRNMSRRSLISEQQYLELDTLFSFNNIEKSQGREPYVNILTDDSGASYALLSESCIAYALSHDSSLVSERMLRHVEDVSNDVSSKIDNPELADDVLIEAPKTIDGYLMLRHSVLPSQYKIIGETLSRDWNRSYENKMSSEKNIIMIIDILGGYLN